MMVYVNTEVQMEFANNTMKSTNRIPRHVQPMLILSLLAAIGMMPGCKATEAPSSGFLPQSELMQRDQSTPFHHTWWNRRFDHRAYTELLVAPVNTDYLMAESFWEKASVANISAEQVKKDIAAIAEYTRAAFVKAANDDLNHRFKVVQEASPKTLILELALVQVVPSKAALNALGYVTWIPTVVTVVGSAGTQSEDTGKGVVAIEGRIRDGATGEIIGMFADREHPKTAIVDLKALNWWAPARLIIDEWAKQLVGLANRPPGAVVKDSPAFELLIW